MGGLRHEEKTHRLRRLIFQVRNTLGAGWEEEIYHQALLQLLNDEKIPVVSKPRHSLVHRQIEIHTFEPDLIVWSLIVLELKALPYQTQFAGQQYAQLIHYLKYHQMDLGLLINFGPPRVQIKRVVWNEPPLGVFEDYDKIKNLLSEDDRLALRVVRDSIFSIAQQYGLGYPETVYRNLLAVEIEHWGLCCQSESEIPVCWSDKILGLQKTQHLLVNRQVLVHVRSLLDNPTTHDFVRMKTFLSAMRLKIGLVVNFGRNQLQIHGVTTK